MGTPLKPMRLFLSPKVLSPSTPRLNKNVHLKTNLNVVRKINFSENIKRIDGNNIKINIIGCDNVPINIKKSILVNTPNKLDILKFGLESTSHLNVLGRGAFGTVVKGQYKGEEVAVKVVKTKAHIRELNILQLIHENIVLIKEIIMQNELHTIIIMEYLHNYQSLQNVLDDDTNNIYFEKIIKCGLDICNALQFCHERNILHLDLKPSNVLVSQEYNLCKLCDFGNCVAIGDIDDDFKHEGTIIYTAPEILLGKLPTSACDIYSLGILFWQLRYRMIPYYNLENKDIVIYKVVKFGLRPTSIHLDVDDEYSQLYQSCWLTDHEQRPKISSVIYKLKQFYSFNN